MTERSGGGEAPPDRRDRPLVALDRLEDRRETAAMGRPGGRGGFVGRADGLAVLHGAFARAAAGTPSMVLVGGEAGMGKSRLVAEFAGRLAAGSATVVVGACVPMDDGGLPFAPVIGILRSLSRQGGDASEASLGALVAQLAGPDDGPEPEAAGATRGGLADELAKTRVFEAILDRLTAAAAHQPLVVVFEDLHWADSASAELLHFLTRNLADAAVLLVGTYRPEDVGTEPSVRRRLHDLRRHAAVTLLHLDGLTAAETAGLVAGLLDGEADAALAEQVWARSEGNPFFAEELTAARHSPSLPRELRDVILTRVDGLADDARHLLQLVAASAAAVDHRLVVAVSTLDADALDHACGELIDRQLLVIDAELGSYQLRHALLREAVYASLLPGERDRIHRRFAAALADDPSVGPASAGQRAAELAAHWWAAGEWAEAQLASVASARAASDLWAFPEALAHLERAVVALDRSGVADDGARVELLELAATTAYLASETQRALELAEAALALVDEDADPLRASRLLTLVGRYHWGLGATGPSFEAHRRATVLASDGEPTVERARALASEAGLLMVTSRLEPGVARCREAITIAQAVGAREVECHARNTLGVCLAMDGDVDLGLAELRTSIAMAEELGDPDALNRGYGNLSSVLLDSGRLEEAATSADDYGPPEKVWGVALEGAANNSAEALLRLGRYDEAEALLGRIGVRGLGSCKAGPGMLQLAIEIRRGDLDAATGWMAEAEEGTAGSDELQMRGFFHLLAGELALGQGRPADAVTHAEAGLDLAAATEDEDFTPELCALGVRALADRYEAASGRAPIQVEGWRQVAADLVLEAERTTGARPLRGFDATPRGLGWARTAVAERSRLEASDPQAWGDAADQWAVAGERYQEAYARWRQAEALIHGGSSRPAAGRALHEADRIARDIGAVGLVEHIEGLARRARIPLLPQSSVDAGEGVTSAATDLGLTPREAEVLVQLALGHTDRDIAEQLFISKKTASVHVSNLIRKLGVPNRIEAGRIGQANLHRLPATPVVA